MISFFQNNLLWTEGRPVLVVLMLALIMAYWLWRPLVYLVLGAFFFSLFFFRNPHRVCPQAVGNSSVVVCPADGKVVGIARTKDVGELEGFAYRISIFLSPLDVHVNWTPVTGGVTRVEYVPGKFVFAFLPKSSLLNEHNDIYLRDAKGHELMVRQIAGTVARRIVCWVKADDAVSVGDKVGMIRFGSRVDVFLPKEFKPGVAVGQRVYGGQTVLGLWS